MTDNLYKEDVLKDGFQQRTISLKNDYEGKGTATLVRRLPETVSDKAVLYVHGFNDYFFQKEMAYKFNEHGFAFYAIDLRKYGRSYLHHQKFNDIRDLKCYYEEITCSLEIIRNEGNKKVILMGHSTGGLIFTIFAKDHSKSNLFDGLILNSPFYEFNQSKAVRTMLPLIALIGKVFPKITVSGGFSEEYGKGLHKSYFGEWEYDLEWKPNVPPKVNLGWIRAIYKAQKELKKDVEINKPVLILHSSKSTNDMTDKVKVQSCDTILNVNDIARISDNITTDRKVVAIEGGMHDLVLSKPPVRAKVYDTIFSWLEEYRLD